MVGFYIYDLIFLAAFLVFFSVFLYTRKKGIKRDGLLLLYRTQWGVKLIDYIGKKYKKTLNVMGYVSVVCGYLLMVGIFYLIYTIVKIYFFSPEVVRAIKVPPILPLVPYLPQVFRLDFLPPFFFTYWIVILAVIAISHEMAHGIFMRRYGIKIKSTGFGFFPFFLPIFLAAFVEQDEKSMTKASRFKQMAVLSAGTFANVIVAVLFFIVLWLFFSFAFTSGGVIFDSYATSAVPIAGITMINGLSVSNPSYDSVLNSVGDDFVEITVNGNDYLATRSILESQIENVESTGEIILYNSAPAINQNLSSIISEINGVPINSIDKLVTELSKYSPGDEITITTIEDSGPVSKSVVLEEHPTRQGESWLGIGFYSQQRSGILGKIVENLSFKNPNVYYEPVLNGFSVFIYNLLWWLVLISISVALINMLPVGIFDGGRFFYLTILSLTKNEKIARRAFAASTYFFLLILLLLMLFWVFAFLF